MIAEQPYTKPTMLADFEVFIRLPRNEHRLFEWIDGEIIEKVPSNAYASEIAQLIAFFIRLFIRQNRIAGHVTDGQGGFMVSGERIAPDVAYISAEHQPQLADEGYNPNPPEIAVEVEHPTSETSERRLRKKLIAYMNAGTIVWVVYPRLREIEVYVPGQLVKTLTMGDKLDGSLVLPGFSLPLSEIFTTDLPAE